MQSAIGGSDYADEFEKELGGLLREQRRIDDGDRERELSICRSGSAPPTVEGSLSAVGGLFGDLSAAAAYDGGGRAFVTDDELRSDPAYISYYYSNVNLNPRLPPPLLSREDWRSAQRVQGGAGLGSVLGGIGDRRKGCVGGDGCGNMIASNFVGEMNGRNKEQGGEWGGDGLIGLPGLGMGGRQRSLADIIQDDLGRDNSLLRLPSRTPSRNSFTETVDASESQFVQMHHEMGPSDSIHSGGSSLSKNQVENAGSSSVHTYASAVGSSLSRSTTPDHQHMTRSPSPRIPSVRAGISDKKSMNGGSSSCIEPSELAAAFSGISLSTNSLMHENNHIRSPGIDKINWKQQSLLNKCGSGNFNVVKSVPYHSNSNGVGLDPNIINASLVDDEVPTPSVNSFLKSPSSPMLNNGGSPSLYQNIDPTNSSFSNYMFTNPGSPSIVGNQFGSSNLPPLFENAAVALAMGANGIDSRGMGRNSTPGPNLMAAAAELKNLSRNGNRNVGNTIQMPLLDPMYIQYLRSAEYAAAAAAHGVINETTMDREYLANSYVDPQKAYLGGNISPHKSQYGLPYLTKPANLDHGYFANPMLGLGMSYGGMASPFIPNSPVGSLSPYGHGDQNARFSPGIRNLSTMPMGSWSSGNLDANFPSTLLEEFKSNKSKCFELSEISGHVVEFSADQYGSRFIQQKLETATAEEKDMVFLEIMPHALSLMTDVFGNYVIQKFFEHGTASQIRDLADQLAGHVLTLSLQMYGCRVIQKAIEVVDIDQQKKMVSELDGHIMRCVRDQNGNHVIQKCIECIPQGAIEFIISTFYSQVVTLSTHPYGCRVIQRVLEHCSDPRTQSSMMDEILQSVSMLAQDQYGNYVVQHVLEHGKTSECSSIIKKLTGQIVQMSQQKFASNVVEKCLSFGDPMERQILVNEMLGSTDENEPLQVMMKDQFANYVVQKVLETCDDQQLELILNRIKVHLNALKKYTYGKHIVARVEKLVAAGERRIGILSLGPA